MENNKVIIQLFGEIEREQAKKFYKEARKAIKENKNIMLLISSPGGSSSQGISIYNYLKGIPIKVDTYNFGQVDSIAAVIFAAGEKRYSSTNASFLIHDTSYQGEDKDYSRKKLTEIMESLKKDSDHIAKILTDNSNLSFREMKEMQKKGITLDAKEAKKIGLVTNISDKLIKKYKSQDVIVIS